jgi:hypothetical protein
MCEHTPACPPAAYPDHDAARIVATYPAQGWSLLCNGVITFDDMGELLPDGSAIAPGAERVPSAELIRPLTLSGLLAGV